MVVVSDFMPIPCKSLMKHNHYQLIHDIRNFTIYQRTSWLDTAHKIQEYQWKKVRNCMIGIHIFCMIMFLVLASIGVYKLMNVYGFNIFNRSNVAQQWTGHRWLGRTTLMFAYVNAALILLKECGKLSSTTYHKVLGWIVCIMIIVVIWTGQNISTKSKLHRNEVFAEIWFPLTITFVIFLAFFVKFVDYIFLCKKDRNKYFIHIIFFHYFSC